MILYTFFSLLLLLSSITFCNDQKTELSGDLKQTNQEKKEETNTPKETIDKPQTTKSEPQCITITNDIKPEMLAYKHWTGTYNPTEFKLTVNGTHLKAGETCHISPDKLLEIRYDYSFMSGKRTGAKIITYELDKDTKNTAITFSWDNEWRVVLDHGKPIKATHISG